MTYTPANQVQAVLVDRRNFASVFPNILQTVLASQVIGFDIETHDADRHDGLNTYMKVNDEGVKSAATKLVFDIPRTTITGFSIWPEGHHEVYYFNTAHADVENRLTFEEVRPIFDQYQGAMIAHNAPFELMMTKACWDIDIKNIFCSLQLAVTAYGPDEYSPEKFFAAGVDNFKPLLADAERLFKDYEFGDDMTPAQGNLFGKVVAKESTAAHSYNGWVKDIAYGYDLKKAVRSWFGYQMMSFKECLGKKAHMGQLTGEEVVAYGCDDAVWCVALFRRISQYIEDTNPQAMHTYYTQENPMVHIYSEVTRNGMRVNRQAVDDYKHAERAATAPILRELRALLVEMYQTGEYFQGWVEGQIYEPYAEKEKVWYRKSGQNTRMKIMRWINVGDQKTPYEEVAMIDGAIASSWNRDMGFPKRKGILNLTHYYVVRTLIYDLCRTKPIMGRGKVVQSDGDAQNLLLDKYGKDSYVGKIISCLKRLTSIDQRIKLYITPYELLIDPDTSKIHSQMNSMLATRRMASSFPNFMQLPKSGGGAYVRSFFLPDRPDHVLLSLDWSQIELVRIAEESQDPEMLKCYQHIPYDDLHRIAYMAVLEITEEMLKIIKDLPQEAKDITFPDPTEPTGVRTIEFVDKNGAQLSPSGFIKYVRKEIGKVSNFNYWYSGALASIGEMMGWPAEKMWAATDRYRGRFPTAEDWRVNLQTRGGILGYVDICDGLRRVRYEATDAWKENFVAKFDYASDGVRKFMALCAHRIARRALNQFVNTKIQGGCAALAKRTIIRSRHDFDPHIRQGLLGFKMSIHDELVWSVQRDFVVDFIPMAKHIMCDHPDMFPSVKLHATASIGLNFQPFDPVECPYGQIELDEAPSVPWISSEYHGGVLPDAEIRNVLQYLAGGVQ